MLVLLPPSEGKTAPPAGRALDLASLSAAPLTPTRDAVLSAVAEVSARPDALEVLGVGATLAAEVAANTRLRESPTAPAARVYTGVLYATAGLAALEGPALARAHRTVRVVSALLGVVGPGDLVPAYRLSMGTTLPGLGPLATLWRQPLSDVLDDEAAGRLVVDCRSAAYAAAWVPPDPSRHVAVRVEREAAGRRTVVSHWAKHARGALLRHLLVRDGAEPATPDELTDVARELVGTGPIGVAAPGLLTSELVTAELGTSSGRPQLTLVVR